MKLVSSSLLVAVAFSVSAAAPAPVPTQQTAAQTVAPSADRLDLARRYVALSNSNDLMEEMRAVMMRSASLNSEDAQDQADAERFLKRVFVIAQPKIRARMPVILEASAQAYAREFSADELQQMIAFAQTATGQHVRARAAAIESDPAFLDAQMGVWEDLGPAMEQVGKEMCAEKAAKRVAAGDKNAKCPLASKDDTAAG